MTKDDLRLSELRYIKLPISVELFKEELPETTFDSTIEAWHMIMQCAVLSIIGRDLDDLGRTELHCRCELADLPDRKSKDARAMYVLDELLGIIDINRLSSEEGEVTFTPAIMHLRMEE